MYKKYVFALLCVFLALPIECNNKKQKVNVGTYGRKHYRGKDTRGRSQRLSKANRKKKNPRGNGKACCLQKNGTRKYNGAFDRLTQSQLDVLMSNCAKRRGESPARPSTPPILNYGAGPQFGAKLLGAHDRGNKDASQLARVAAAQKVGPEQRHVNPGRVTMLRPYFQSLSMHAGNFQGYEAGYGR